MPGESLVRTPARETVAVRSSVRCVLLHKNSTKITDTREKKLFLCRELAAAMCRLELWPGALAVVETHLEFMQQCLR